MVKPQVKTRVKARIGSGLLACLFLLLCLFTALPAQVLATGEQVTDFQTVNAAAAYCVDTKQVLYTSRGEETFAPGIVTKLASLMTAYDIVTDCNRPLTTEITVRGAWVQGSYVAGDRSSPYLGLADGETYTLEYLFATALVANANDALAVLVHYCAEELMQQTEAAFLNKMNDLAASLELENTVFEDTVGFGGKGRTTVTDAVRLAAAFYLYNDLVDLSNRESYGSIHNKNYLKSDFVVEGYLLEGAIGLLAGQATDQGNYSVVTAYEQEGVAYVFVVMGAPSMKVDTDGTWFEPGSAYEDVLGLVPHVLSGYGFVQLCQTDDILAELRLGGGAEKDFLILVPAQSIELMVPNLQDQPIEVQITYDSEKVYDSELNGKTWKTADAPVRQGDVLGSASFTQNGKVLATVDLVARESVNTDALKTTFTKLREFLFDGAMGKIIKIILLIVAGWIVLSIIITIVRIILWFRRRRRRKRLEKERDF